MAVYLVRTWCMGAMNCTHFIPERDKAEEEKKG
jgi:hypothetical protein